MKWVYALVALPARRVVHTYLPGPSSARKKVYGATVCGVGRGPCGCSAGRHQGVIRRPVWPGFGGKLLGESLIMGSGSFLGRKTLEQSPDVSLTSPQFLHRAFSRSNKVNESITARSTSS